MVASQRPATFAYSYGYDRAEVLAAFSNALFLTFVCLFIVAGAAGRVVESGTPGALASLRSARILEFGVLGLALNVGGVLMLGQGASVQDAVTRFASAMQDHMGGGGGAAYAGSTNGPALLPGGGGGGGAGGIALSAVYANLVSHAASSLTVIVSSLLITYEGWLWVSAVEVVVVVGDRC